MESSVADGVERSSEWCVVPAAFIRTSRSFYYTLGTGTTAARGWGGTYVGAADLLPQQGVGYVAGDEGVRLCGRLGEGGEGGFEARAGLGEEGDGGAEGCKAVGDGEADATGAAGYEDFLGHGWWWWWWGGDDDVMGGGRVQWECEVWDLGQKMSVILCRFLFCRRRAACI